VWLGLSGRRPTQSPPKALTWIEVEPEKKSKEQAEKDRKRRIVQTDPGKKTPEAPHDSFLGFQNQKVDRETVSKKRTTALGSTPKDSSSKRKKTLSNLGLPIIPSSPKLDMDRPEWATPGTRPQDYIQGLNESDKTALNTREYLFYSYFQRIRDRLDHAWVPILREKLVHYHKAGRQLAADTDHVTKVMVVLNESGEITRVKLVSESGTRDLDDAAVAAFRQAGPFPNPPKGMVDLNHEIQIPWDFILKT